jgi:hypothetical protein
VPTAEDRLVGVLIRPGSKTLEFEQNSRRTAARYAKTARTAVTEKEIFQLAAEGTKLGVGSWKVLLS